MEMLAMLLCLSWVPSSSPSKAGLSLQNYLRALIVMNLLADFIQVA